jgi:hypothetical protein
VVSTVPEHLEQARINEAVLNFLPENQHDWRITVQFYAGLHYISAVALRLGAPRPQNHGERFEYLSRVRIPPPVRRAFDRLFYFSLAARYDCISVLELDEDDERATQALTLIREYVLGLLN